MRESLPQHTVVLLGAGHTNSHVIRMWRMQPLRDVQLICVSDFGMATYSGMLPGTLAGQYDLVEMQIDLVRLCAAAGVRLLRAEVTGLDADNCELLLADRPPLRYDLLSIGIGSVPATVPDASGIGLAIKPMQTFLDRLDQRLAKLAEARLSRPWRIAIAGAGAAGFEIACCLPSRIRRAYGMAVPEVTLVDRSPEMLSGMPARTRELARRELAARGIQVLLGREIVRIDENGQLCYADGNTLEFDLVIWATSAQAPPLLSCFDLPTDDRGFLLTRDTLQSVGSDAVFAVGDTGTCENHPRPKAGVYAVRQSPVLWENIRRHFAGRPPVRWRPQSSFLSLLNTGDGKAIFTYKRISLHARWCWKLKDAIDRRFMAKFQDYQPAMRSEALVDLSSPMYCGGCGCKVGGDLLTRVLRRLNNPPASHVLVGLAQPDDVALLLTAEGTATAATADFFTAFLDDPYLLGRIAALNALSDMYAKGAKSLGALALVTVPHGPPAEQEQFLLQLLDGSLRELRAADVPLVGGHTIEAAQTTIGFTILGEVAPTALAGKGQLREGDRLVLTKPLGTGVLLAAHMQARCQSDWMESLLDCMLTSNQAAGAIAQQFQLKAVTDVTGFGLVGHLLEMLQPAGLSAELSLAAIPLLSGVRELLGEGIESTLAPANRLAGSHVHCSEVLREGPCYAALFDPQTSGGLLAGVAPEQTAALLDHLGDSAKVIGQVLPVAESQSKPQVATSTIHLRGVS